MWGVLVCLQPIAVAVVLTTRLGIYALALGFAMPALRFRVRNRGGSSAAAAAAKP